MKSSTRCCFSFNRLSFLAHVAHRALLCALRLSLFSEPSLTCLGLQIWRFSAASAIGALSHIRCPASELSGGHASRLAVLLCRETRQDCVPLASPNIQDKGQHVVESHHLHADMSVIYHPHDPAETGCLTLVEECL